jgi:hypothetical protein
MNGYQGTVRHTFAMQDVPPSLHTPAQSSGLRRRVFREYGHDRLLPQEQEEQQLLKDEELSRRAQIRLLRITGAVLFVAVCAFIWLSSSHRSDLLFCDPTLRATLTTFGTCIAQ